MLEKKKVVMRGISLQLLHKEYKELTIYILQSGGNETRIKGKGRENVRGRGKKRNVKEMVEGSRVGRKKKGRRKN